MVDSAMRWPGVTIYSQPVPGDSSRRSVVFNPHTLQGCRGPNGETSRVPMPGEVVVKVGTTLEVESVLEPEHRLPEYSNDDYREKALEIVQAEIKATAKGG